MSSVRLGQMDKVEQMVCSHVCGGGGGGGQGRSTGHVSEGEGAGYSVAERHESSKPEQEFISSVRLGQVDKSGTNVM